MNQPLTLSQVRKRAEAHIDALKEALTRADPDKIPALQADVRAMRSLIAWLDQGAPPPENPVESPETPGPSGGY